ncbi:cyclin-O [Salarias fasciatus]|uniref:cyclin-O n=1 Tax=Salarias fasciatus TaxID=181472 RepID=UPI0011770444|nr:cyclin-O [Salarias fasciatus]
MTEISDDQPWNGTETEKGDLRESGEDPGNVTSPGGTPLSIPQAAAALLPHTSSHRRAHGPRRSSPDMVSFGSETVHKRRRSKGASPRAEALTPAQQRQTARHRKQKLMSRLGDSGFEEDLRTSPVSSAARIDVSPEPAPGQPSSWYLQYGDIGFKIQREKEAQFHPCQSLAHQPQLTAEARCKLVSWLIGVHKHYGLSFECCCLAVSIVDRFLAATPVAADCFQLLGVTALLLASKQVEVCSPRISHLLSLCCGAFTKEQLCNLECLILVRLNFSFAAPTLAFFLDYYTSCMESVQPVAEDKSDDRLLGNDPDRKSPRQCSKLAQKVCELSLADYAFNRYPPSLTASCALKLASELLKTEQDFPEHTAVLLQEDHLDRVVNELCPTPVSVHSCVDLESHSYSLFQECKDNLKLLVSLNQETLDVMSSM